MLQELFRIPGLDWPVYGYGLMLVLGVWAGVELARYLANRFGVNGDDFVMMGLLALAAGVFGSRLSHVLENFSNYTDPSRSAWENLRAAANLSEGGLTFYGGFLLATPVLIAWALWKKIPIRRGMDIIAPCLMVGLAFGRVGCLLNGCCFGQTCDPDRVPWAITFPYGSPPYQQHFADGDITIGPGAEQVPPGLTERVLTDEGIREILVPKSEVAENPDLVALAQTTRSHPVHPAQLYSAFNAFLIAGACLAFLTLRPAQGRVFALMMLLYGPSRFALELVRTEPPVMWGMSFSMWMSIFVTAGGVLLWLLFRRRSGDESAAPAVATAPATT